tara:strand:+ start:71 stop:694 length:624 start_codon:yes stop_codon:yes gene_type:complete
MPDFSFEEKTGETLVAGVDEAGCGPWAGPVVAGAVLFLDRSLPKTLNTLLDDSKKLTPLKRETVYQALADGEEEGRLVFASAMASVDEIDHLNIRQAALTAMQRAVEALTIKPSYALVDGTGKPKLECPLLSLIKGDSLSCSIAAASVIAKVERDREMKRLAALFPGYGWERNAGYGTKAHQEALDSLGVTPHHRRSFAPIRKRLAA